MLITFLPRQQIMRITAGADAENQWNLVAMSDSLLLVINKETGETDWVEAMDQVV